jgi:hypothetical protein
MFTKFKYVLGVLLLVNGVAWAQLSTFSTTVGMAVLCLSDVEPGFFYNYMSQIKPPARREHGAFWFKTSEQLFGAPLSEVFVSDGSTRHSFVGVVSSLPPDQLAATVAATAPAGGSFKKRNPADKYSTFISSSGAEIAFQGKNGKLFCRRDRVRVLD